MTRRPAAALPLRWAAPVLAALALWASGPMWRYGVEAIGYPYQLDPIESKVLQHALWLRAGRPIYFPIGPAPPWVVGNYPPLFPLLCAAGVDAAQPDFAWPRALTLLSTLAAGLAMACLLWRATRSVALAALGPGLWWASYEVHWWAPLCRVDLPALALGAAGLLVGVASLGRWSWPRVVAAAGLFWLAWLTKQSQVLLPLALIVWMARADRRWAWRLALVWAAGLAVLLGALVSITRGEFWTLTVEYNVNAWVEGQLRAWVLHLVRMWPAGLAALAVGLCLRALSHGRAEEPLRGTLGVLGWALALNAGNVAALGKVGADKNYLLEPLWCLSGLLPLLWWRVTQGQGVGVGMGRTAFSALMSAAVSVQVLWHVAMPYIPAIARLDGPWPNRAAWRPRIGAEDLARDRAVDAAVFSARGPVLCEYGIFALRAGQDLVLEPFLMSRLALEGRWDETPLLERVRRREFALIVVEDDLSHPGGRRLSATPTFAEAVRENYALERTLPGVITQHIWRPR